MFCIFQVNIYDRALTLIEEVLPPELNRQVCIPYATVSNVTGPKIQFELAKL